MIDLPSGLRLAYSITVCVQLSDKCYLGHHLEIGSTVYYLFDYGDEWEHDITVKKVINAEPKYCHIEVQKITGKIPKQYPDWDE